MAHADVTVTTRRPAAPRADFAFYIDFERGKGSASRVFSATHAFIKACERLDRELVTSIDSSIETVMVLEDIQAASLKTWFRSILRAADDQALKELDWKPIVGAYLVQAKYMILRWIDDNETQRSLPNLGRNIQKLTFAICRITLRLIPPHLLHRYAISMALKIILWRATKHHL